MFIHGGENAIGWTKDTSLENYYVIYEGRPGLRCFFPTDWLMGELLLDLQRYKLIGSDDESESGATDSHNSSDAESIRSNQVQSRTVTHTRGRLRARGQRRGRPQRRAPKAFISEYYQVEAHDLGLMEQTCPHCGALHWLAECSTNSSILNPRWQLCCQNGKVDLLPISEPPSFLLYLFEDNDDTSKHFHQNSQ